jgi:hypothetical protein
MAQTKCLPFRRHNHKWLSGMAPPARNFPLIFLKLKSSLIHVETEAALPRREGSGSGMQRARNKCQSGAVTAVAKTWTAYI